MNDPKPYHLGRTPTLKQAYWRLLKEGLVLAGAGALTIADDGRERGTIWFDAGKMVHARAGTSQGVDAAVDLFTSRRGQFVFKHGVTPPNGANTIDASLDEVWKLVRERG